LLLLNPSKAKSCAKLVSLVHSMKVK
jgi:hypothetical protein